MEQRVFSVPEMASSLDISQETIRKYIHRLNIIGQPGKDTKGKSITVYSYLQYGMIRDTIEGNKVVEKNYYTTTQVMELAGCSWAHVLNIAKEFDIYKIVKPTSNSRAAYFPKESMEKIVDIVEARRKARRDKAKEKAIKIAEANKDAVEDEHPLVTDKNCLKLSYWPETVPNCFED